MRTSTLAEATKVYECAIKAKVVRTRLSHERFRTYSLSLRRLVRAVGEDASDEVWKTILSPIRRYGFSLCAAPLPFNEASIRPNLPGLRSRREDLALVYPAQAILLAATLDHLEALIASNENPLGFWLSQSAMKNDPPGAVLVCDSRLVELSERQLVARPATRHLQIVTPAQLTRDSCFTVLFVLGAARWFPSFVFEAPRANAIELVSPTVGFATSGSRRRHFLVLLLYRQKPNQKFSNRIAPTMPRTFCRLSIGGVSASESPQLVFRIRSNPLMQGSFCWRASTPYSSKLQMVPQF